MRQHMHSAQRGLLLLGVSVQRLTRDFNVFFFLYGILAVSLYCQIWRWSLLRLFFFFSDRIAAERGVIFALTSILGPWACLGAGGRGC